MILIAIASDAKDLEDIQQRLNATIATKFIAAIPIVVLPRNMGEAMVTLNDLKPLLNHLNSKFSQRISVSMFEAESQKLPNT